MDKGVWVFRSTSDRAVCRESLTQRLTRRSAGQSFAFSVKRQSVVLEGFAQSIDELTAKDLTENLHGQQEFVSQRNPSGVIERKTASRNHSVNANLNYLTMNTEGRHRQALVSVFSISVAGF